MKVSEMKPLLLLICSLFAIACQHREKQESQESDKKQDYVYTPEKGPLLVISKTINPEIKKVSLFGDNEKDSITSVVPENGKFKLEVDTVNLREVYFLKIEGKSTKPGTTGLAWEALLPVLTLPSTELVLLQKNFNHVGSISKVAFSIGGSGEEQDLLNAWHTAIAALEAEEESQTEQYAIAGGSATKVSGRKKLSSTPSAVTENFIGQHKPFISSFYLLSRVGKQRQYAKAYEKLLEQSPEQVRKSKYGLDFAKRLEQLQRKVKQLDLEKQVVATDGHLSEIPWDSFKNHKYLLLSFWNSADQTSAKTVKHLEKVAPEFTEKGIEIMPISLEDRFTVWKENTENLDFKYNYRMRNEAKQDLINTLYISELPRLILVKPSGEVINDDLSLEELNEIN